MGFSLIVTARKRSLQRLCFHRCLSVLGGLHPTGVSVQGVLGPGGHLSRGLCPGGSLYREVSVMETPHMVTRSSTHPAGMHSCFV